MKSLGKPTYSRPLLSQMYDYLVLMFFPYGLSMGWHFPIGSMYAISNSDHFKFSKKFVIKIEKKRNEKSKNLISLNLNGCTIFIWTFCCHPHHHLLFIRCLFISFRLLSSLLLSPCYCHIMIAFYRFVSNCQPTCTSAKITIWMAVKQKV